MKRNIKKIIGGISLAVMLLAGCGTKQAEENKQERVETTASVKAVFEKAEIVNVIANDPAAFSDLLYAVKLEEGQSVTAASFTYGGETVKLKSGEATPDKMEDKKAAAKVFTVSRDEKVKEFVNKNNVPNAVLTFLSASKTASDLKVTVTITDKEKKTSDTDVNIKVRVLPETVKPVKAITQNLKLSESLKAYDFDVRAKNIADKVPEAVSSITVKKSNVKFGKAGHYEVTYEIKMNPSNLDAATDVEAVDKETEKTLPKDEVTKENVKPDETVEVTTDVEVTDKKADDVITDEKDTTENTDSSTPSGGGNAATDSASSGGSSSSGGGASDSSASNNSTSGNVSSGGSPSKNTPAPEQHTHSWTPHTATKQVWIPNVVTVTDYGTQAAHRYDTRCSECGAIFGSPDACADHTFSTGHGGAQNIDCTHTTQVVTGSHTEDHGHNETQSYTDYYYCSCGATK